MERTCENSKPSHGIPAHVTLLYPAPEDADAVARVRPFGIDVSSGVEQSPGVKDHQRLRALFEALHDTSPFATRS